VSMILADPLSPSALGDYPAHGNERRRWEIWRSPEGQPAWARPVLLGIAAAAALLYAWNITQAGLAPFYSVAVKSMSESWKAFFYGAFDPRATITIDKLAGSFLPQALSARIFGFHPWSLALPQVIEGVISVLVMYRVVRRWAGVMPGQLAAALFTLTPIAASMFGHSMEDGALTLCLVLAADAYQRAVTEARFRSLIWSGVWVGLGFQAKMMQAWMILPALAIGYLIAAPAPLRRRIGQLGVAGVVMLAVSLSWIALYTFTPASDRPYVDGSTDNSAAAMVFGYNGLERFGISIPGAVTSGPGVSSGRGGAGGGQPSTAPARGPDGPAGARTGAGQAPGGSGTGGTGFPGAGAGGGPGSAGDPGSAGGAGSPAGQAAPGATGHSGTGNSAAGNSAAGNRPPGGTGTGSTGTGGGIAAAGAPAAVQRTAGSSFGQGWTKLLGSDYGPEIGWLYPLALLALIFGLLWTRRAPRTDQVRAGFVMWGSWLLTVGLIFSKMSTIPHTAYMSSLAPPLAALSAAGLVMFWRYYRAGDARGWLLPVAVAAELAWALFLWRDYGGFLPWARTATVVAGVIAIVVMVVAKLTRRAGARLATAGLAVGVVAALAAPSAWAASVLDTRYGGSSFNASAGPAGAMGGGPAVGGAGPSLTSGQARDEFVERFRGDGGYRSGAGRYGRRTGDRGFGGAGFGGAGGGGAGGGGAGGGGAGGGGAGGILGSTTELSAGERELYDYVNAHRDGASYLMAVSSWTEASPYILSTGQEVMPMGGFSGAVPEPTLARVKELVSSGQLRFFLLSSTGSGRGLGGGDGSAVETVTSWVQGACHSVPARDYGGTTTAAGSGGAGTLYECGASS
jgi:4-amino-4-deoxy-L-arabinose transferase-like glycosyltransferase